MLKDNNEGLSTIEYMKDSIPNLERNKFQKELIYLCIPDFELKSPEEERKLSLEWFDKYATTVSDVIDYPEKQESKEIRSLIMNHEYKQAAELAAPIFMKDIEHAEAA